jgi:RNA polymerase subunit RPABC4/transcription elongation factor Spt4
VNCPACSQEISDLSEFCPHCHVRVKGDLRCADCKFVLAPNAKACPSCGSKKTEPRHFDKMPHGAARLTHHMAEVSSEPKKRPPRRLGRLKHRTNAQPIGWSNLLFAAATMAGFLFLPINR